MKKITLPLAAVTLVTIYAGVASAQCDFNAVPARGVKGSMVRNFAPCPGTEHPAGEVTATKSGTPACAPVEPRQYAATGLATQYKFGPKGKCSVSTSAKLVAFCDEIEDANNPGMSLGLPHDPCHVTYVKSKCSGIVDALGEPIKASDVGWKLATMSRASLDDQVGGDMTVIDFPVTFDYSIPDNGKISVDSNSAQALADLIGTNAADLPPCTSIEVVNVVIKAPGGSEGLPFAKLGQATKPKE
jgi:hypothetical protein